MLTYVPKNFDEIRAGSQMRVEYVESANFDSYSTVALVPPMSTMYVWRGIT